MIIGICGGSGSGKTTVAKKLVEVLGETQTVLLAQDSYYKDHSDLSLVERAKVNFDHPESVDFDLLIGHLHALKRNQPVDRPHYDFTQHLRTTGVQRLEPKPIIIVEGIMILHEARLREMFDLKVYVDTEADIRLIRRLRRDVRDRGRTMEAVVDQYLSTVRPMHLKFVEPGKEFAEIVIHDGGKNPRAIDLVVQRVKMHLA
jgi:uridine kinase